MASDGTSSITEAQVITRLSNLDAGHGVLEARLQTISDDLTTVTQSVRTFADHVEKENGELWDSGRGGAPETPCGA